MTAVYNQAQRSPCVMRFHIAAEGGWDVGVSGGLALAALAVWRGVTVAHAILLSLVGAGFAMALLHRYYVRHPSETVAASQSEAAPATPVFLDTA